MKHESLRSALIVAFTGFLFGFDSVLISGVNLPIKNHWQISDWYHGAFIVSIALWGTVAGALIGGYPTNSLGRKPTLIIVGVMFMISALGTAFAASPLMFSVFRLLGGVACGIGSIAAPAYLVEVSSARHRGKLGVLFQLNIVTGILLAFLSNYLLEGWDGANDWRWMLGVLLVPATAYTIALLFTTESRRWLDLRVSGPTGRTLSVDPPVASMEMRMAQTSRGDRLFSRRYRKVLVISFLITFFNQFSGISFVLFYAPEILERAGFATADSLLSSVYIGGVNLAFTLIGIALIDGLGRRTLMVVGSVGYIMSLTMIAYSFYVGLSGSFTLVFILLFIISHAVGQGAVIWVFLAEIFPTRVRAYGQAWSSGLLNGFAAVVALSGAVVMNAFDPWQVFAFLALLMVFQLLFTLFVMPETKGVVLEDLETTLTRSE